MTFILHHILHIVHTIAGMERGKFENKEVTFEEHIKREHSLWHYLFFIVHIKTKEATEYTGPESYVSDMINVSKIGSQGIIAVCMAFDCVYGECVCMLRNTIELKTISVISKKSSGYFAVLCLIVYDAC